MTIEVATAKMVRRCSFCVLLAGHRLLTLASILHMLECIFAFKLLNNKLRFGIEGPMLKNEVAAAKTVRRCGFCEIHTGHHSSTLTSI